MRMAKLSSLGSPASTSPNSTMPSRISAANSSPSGRRATPTMENSLGSNPTCSRWKSAGNSFRFVKSPDAPNITMIPGSGIMVIFGASGDLTKRKLLPALFHLEQVGLLPKEFSIVGVARRPLGDEFAADMRRGIVEFGDVDVADPKLDDFTNR